MAPTSTRITHPSASPSASGNPNNQPFVPIALLVFLGLCMAYTVSYLLYRYVMGRRLGSQGDVPDSPSRGVTKFMNGYRLTLNLGNHHLRSSPTRERETPTTPFDEAKHVTTPDHQDPTTSPGISSPFIILTPSFTVHSGAEFERLQSRGQPPPQDHQDSSPSRALTEARPETPGPVQPPTSFTQRVAAKVKFLSRDRVEAIALDPKLAPVQGPLRPLSMVPSPPRKKSTRGLLGLGLKHAQETDTAKDSWTR